MKTITKGLVGTVAAGAMVMTAAAPAMARDRDDGIDVGDVIAGAVIIGGIAAIAGAFDGDDDRRYRDRYYRGGGNYGYNSRGAIERCVAAVENNARRYGYRSANVTQIRDVDGRRGDLRVKGRIAVDGRYDRYGYGRYDRGRGYDQGSFTCRIDRGRVRDIDYNGIRGLR